MFTPQEVSEKTFPKSSSFSSGYDLAAVDEFLDTLTEDYTALYKENAALKAKLKILAEKLEEYRATEDTMRSMLLAAQKMAASMTDLPVLGVPVQSKALKGLDSLLSIVQMPGGVPVATLAIGEAGAANAATQNPTTERGTMNDSSPGSRRRIQRQVSLGHL